MALESAIPAEMQLVRDALATYAEGLADTIYRLMSAFVHGTTSAVLAMTTGIDDLSETGVAQARLGMSVGRVALLTAGPVHATHAAIGRAVVHFGRDTKPWDQLFTPISVLYMDAAQAELARHPAIFG